MQADQSARNPDAMRTPFDASFRPAIATGQQARQQASISTHQLFQGSQEILIDHHGETYRLRITKNDKLILTK